MSVIVKGMEMPENCAECKLKTWINTDPYCTAIQSKLEWNKYSSGSWVGIDKRCPLRPLPEKHGDLVDISQQVNIEYFDDMNQEWSWKAGTVADALVVCEEFPTTIVEEEE